VSIILDLFSAGADTTTNSIGRPLNNQQLSFIIFISINFRMKGFAVLYLIHYPEMQSKIQAELDGVCGDSLPTLAHRSRFNIKR